MNPAEIRQQFARARATGLRAREAAESLGLSEGSALAAHTGEHEAPLKSQALRPDWLKLLESLEACGPLMALTRNDSVVHEKTGIYSNLSQQGQVGMALGADIDLRLFFSHWHAGMAGAEHVSGLVAPAELGQQGQQPGGKQPTHRPSPSKPWPGMASRRLCKGTAATKTPRARPGAGQGRETRPGRHMRKTVIRPSLAAN